MQNIKQKLFNIAVNGICEQDEQSITGDSCKYRRDDGKKCAVGYLINDKHYNECFEGKNITSSVMRAVAGSQGIDSTPTIITFLTELQRIHDNKNLSLRYTWTNRFLRQAMSLAKKHGLSMDEIEYELTEPTEEHV